MDALTEKLLSILHEIDIVRVVAEKYPNADRAERLAQILTELRSNGVVDVPATDPAGYMASGKREPIATAFTSGEAAHIEFAAGRKIARAGQQLPDHASNVARNGYQYEQALMQAASKPVDAAASHE